MSFFWGNCLFLRGHQNIPALRKAFLDSSGVTQLTFTCTKSTIAPLENGVKYVQSDFIVSFQITSHLFVVFFFVDLEQVDGSRVPCSYYLPQFSDVSFFIFLTAHMENFALYAFKRQSHKMVKCTQTIRQLINMLISW